MYQIISGFTGLCIVISALNRSSHANTGDFSLGVQIGIFIGISLITLYFIGKLRNALKYEDKLKKLYIEENDERRRLIQQKTGKTTTIIVAFSMAIAIVIAGFYNFVVLITLLSTLLFLFIITAFVKYYYNKKY
ncbi:hypothetical protein [Bacillus sp. OK048]|uniref:hypothetical protein n=1 Tax=Bacillus sp. OK048 TaxID=1882761 RepID=UPI00088F2014|nr:hypothetical protein [Bacillus sp. OK048]SDN65129.1 hypothetical protein SAMN05443253_115117 [Bacillus sp. OK048]